MHAGGGSSLLLALVSLILVTSLVLLAIRRDHRCILLALTCLSLFVFIFSTLMYIAKKGGIGREVSTILFGTRGIRTWFMYRIVTFEQLGFMSAVGRYSFPLLLVLTSLDMAWFPLALKAKRRSWALFILPVLIMVAYIPSVFRALIRPGESVLMALVYASRTYVYLYIAMAVATLVGELVSITLPFFRRRFFTRSSILISLALIYAFYAVQDPAQIYMFYSSDYMFLLGMWYLSPALSPALYALVIVGSVLFGLVGFVSMLRYARTTFDERREEITLRRSASLAAKGVSMFFHGTKNELIAQGLLVNRLMKKYPHDEDLNRLSRINQELSHRLDSLHKASRSEISTLSIIPLSPVIDRAVDKVRSHHPDAGIELVSAGEDIQVLADGDNLAEAVANILMNAVEAQIEADPARPVELEYATERLWVSIRITDHGKGIGRRELRQIWQPFYTSKSSSQNWGMGMYFSRNVVRSHLGSIRYEGVEGGGSSFIILLPKLGVPYSGED